MFSLGLRKKKEKNPEAQLEGTDWESVNYQMKKLACEEDEITGKFLIS